MFKTRIYRVYSMCTSFPHRCIGDETLGWVKAKKIATAPRTEDYVGCKRCESACPMDFLSVCVYLWHETTRSMGLCY